MSSIKVKFVEFYFILFFNIKKGRLAALGVKSKKNLYMVGCWRYGQTTPQTLT